MRNIIKQYNQIWKDMGFISYGDCFVVNIFRGVFWSAVILIGIYLALELLWVIDYLVDGQWN
jgi:hypothetical protein